MAEMKIAIDGITPSGGAMPVTGTQTVPYRQSVSDGGTAAAPAAGAAVATIASGGLPAGLYDIEVFVGMAGTLAAAADTSNMALKYGATTLIDRIAYAANGTSNPVAGPYRFRATLDGSAALTVNAVGAATASSTYTATITATQVN
ncbi:hypothetical protein [Streptomyces cinereoruber]|uniref:hypothetical protein n=1 Tax=Streptomyces cinereoruber TaxID=67260 RepID=UPI00366A277C